MARSIVGYIGLLALAIWLAGAIAASSSGLAALAMQAIPQATPDQTALAISGLVEHPGTLTLADLTQLPTQTVEVSFETVDGERQQHSYTGVPLIDVLQLVGVTAEPGDRTPLLRRYLIVSAKDDYRIVLSGGELDPQFGNEQMLLAWERDGQPLTGAEAPFELVAPGDTLASRYVWGVTAIEVLGITSAPEG